MTTGLILGILVIVVTIMTMVVVVRLCMNSARREKEAQEAFKEKFPTAK